MTTTTTTDTTGTETKPDTDQTQQGKTFTEAEVNDIVRDRLKQQAANKFGDYDELKTKAGTAQTLEERLGTLESELSSTKASALRTSIAAEFGISTKKGPKGEPSDADLFLTGSDQDTLTAQASRLAETVADRKKNGNVAPKEGVTKQTGKTNTDEREFVSNLFGSGD
ncbi:MAG: hypothetical protein EPO52_17615 [Herbiconiux sp.]|uniref:hypothetical protein n=1 Tax=Herbiconiux sp. TaxID=1871186 RepID=UPI0012072E7D|nr:hypothetical protein [Herbiconiux sp.]TAJ46351.1 MAG: hypothetical protein EPO52_17615 [Herbiconiux sp.]